MTQKVRFGGWPNSVKKAVGGAVIVLCAAALVLSGCNQAAGPDTVEPGTTVTVDRTVPLPDKPVVKEAGEDLAAVLQRLKTGLEDAGDTGYPDLTHYIIDLKDYDDTEYLAPTDGEMAYAGIVAVDITIKNTGAARKTITLKKTGAGGTAYQAADQGSLFIVSEGVLLVFEGDITLDGLRTAGDGIDNTASVVRVLAYGRLEINDGVIISGNTNTVTAGVFRGGGVTLTADSFFTMNGGSIYGNTAAGTGNGGGVNTVGTFTMNGGDITGNIGANGGGIWTAGGSVLTFNNGRIENNEATNGGGGVYFTAPAATAKNSFFMNGGSITGNTAGDTRTTAAGVYGGGVYIDLGTGNNNAAFTMTGGSITGNNSALGFGEDADIYNSGGTVDDFKISGTARIGKIFLRGGVGTATNIVAVITIAGDFIGAGTVATIDLAGNANNEANSNTVITNWQTSLIKVLQIDTAYTGTFSADNLPATRFQLGRFINLRATPVIPTAITGYVLDRTTGTLKSAL